MMYCPYCEAKGKKELLHYCGTTQDVVGTKSTYSFGKGIAGSLLLGPVGAVAGINGKQKNITQRRNKYLCYGCGAEITE